VRRENWNGGPPFGDGGDFGYPFWGSWADGTFIGEDKLLREGDTATVVAKGLEAGKSYAWYAVARGALLEYYGAEPDAASDEKRSDAVRFSTVSYGSG
jgi:hypothetical protein